MSRPSAGREGEGTAPRAAIASVSGTSGVRRLPRAHHSSGARVAFWIPKRRAARPQSHRADLPLELALVQRPARVVAGGPHGVEAAVHVRDQDLLALDLRADDLSPWDVGDLSDTDSCHAPPQGQ